MLRLIKLEWSKFKKNTTLTLLFIFFCVFFPATLFFGSILPTGLPNFLPSKDSFFSFPGIWEYLGYAGNWIVFFFLGVIVIYTFTIEVSNKTLRQSIINGLTRQEVFISKLLNVVLLSAFATLYYTLLSFIIGLINTEDFSLGIAFSNEMAIPRFFLMSFSYMTFALFLAFVFRKAGIAVFFYISYVIIIEPLIRMVAKEKIYSGAYINYFPMNATEDLMPLLGAKTTNSFPTNMDFAFLLTFKEAAIFTIIYTLIFLFISYSLFIKKDI